MALQTWLRLDGVPGLGPVRARRLLQSCSLDDLARMNAADLAARGWRAPQIHAFLHPDTAGLAEVQAWLQAPAHHLLTWDHPAYPPLLRQAPAPPLLLFVAGAPALLSSMQVALVGTRNPTPGGQEAAACLSRELAQGGVTITSGLALGIDGICHRAALQVQGLTLAVLGSGLARCYPRRHQPLAEAIVAEGGALVSEFWPQTAPRPEHFPRRNRIISGLSLGTVVVEAAEQSGSLITARYALEQGREVFAVPGSIHNPQARGCHRLIQQGAKLVASAADILEELAPLAGFVMAQRPGGLKGASDLPFPALLDNVGYEATATDLIIQRSGLPVAEVMRQLLELELAGGILSVPGGYVRARRD